jgi:hypothetical protein
VSLTGARPSSYRERLVDLQNDGTLLADTMDEVIKVCDELADEVGAQAMRDGGVDGQWQSREVVVHGLGPEKVRISVKGWWVDHYFSGGISAVVTPVDGGE